MSEVSSNGENHNQDPQHEALLTPEAMEALGTELLRGFEDDFPEIGEIPVVVNTPEPNDPDQLKYFQCGKKGRRIYVPGEGERKLLSGVEPRDDFVGGFVETFGKVVTIRIRGDVPAPKPDRHKEVPRIARLLANPEHSDDTERALEAMHKLHEVVRHNLGEAVSDESKEYTIVLAYLWLIERVNKHLLKEAA